MFHPEGPTFLELARQALSSTTRGYDLLAPKFEHTPFRTPDELLGPLVEAAAEEPVDAALDVCCGTGAAMRALRPICEERVAGIDLSSGMLAEARRQLADAPGDAEVELVEGDTFEMEFDEEFDVVTCCGAFGHILPPDQDRFAERVRAALRPGGRFLFVTREMPSMREPAWWLARGFNAAMHVRNAVLEPPFIMFYLTFTLGRAREVLGRHGFELDVRAPYGDTEFPEAKLVVATHVS
jgi:ubiquinone/menaquinone biosynthesis C-methylase UbiE